MRQVLLDNRLDVHRILSNPNVIANEDEIMRIISRYEYAIQCGNTIKAPQIEVIKEVGSSGDSHCPRAMTDQVYYRPFLNRYYCKYCYCSVAIISHNIN